MRTLPPPTADQPPSSRRARQGPWSMVGLFALVGLAAGLAASSGVASGLGSKSAVVLPVAGGIVVGLAILALTRFQVYVMAMLILRSSLDLVKLSGRTAGNTSVSTGSRALDPSSILGALFLIAAALWLAAQFRANRGHLPGSRLRKALVVFLVAGMASVAVSSRPTSSLLEVVRIGAVVAMFAVLEQMMIDPQKMRQILGAAFCSVAIPITSTMVGLLTGHARAEHKGSLHRIVGTFNQSNDFGRYLMLFIIMGIALYPHVERRWRQLLSVTLPLMGVALFLTYTRSALIATVLGVLVVGWYQNRRIIRWLIALCLVGVVVVPSMSGRFSSLGSTDASKAGQPSSSNSGNSLQWRLGYWTKVVPLANRSPVIGIGLNMTQYNTDESKQPHNDFLRAYVETGIIGLGAYVWMIVMLVLTARRATARAEPDTFDRGVAVGFLGCVVAFVAVSAVANVISNVVNLWYFFTFAAAASAVLKRSSEAPVAT